MEKITIKMPFHLIQQIRLVHAISECQFDVSIPNSQKNKFTVFDDYMGINLVESSPEDIDISGFLKISHKAPKTSLGSIDRSLIFPAAITQHCRQLWKSKRKHKYSFQGLVTQKRQNLLEKWISEKLLKRPYTFNDPESLWSKLRSRIFPEPMIEGNTKQRKIKDLLLWESDRGRTFPIKSWDELYFEVLSNTEFVLCPSGDFIWSYRFFESILCGAIPIVEESCEAYEGFKYFTMNDDLSTLQWSKETAIFNYDLCVQRITVPTEEINLEIAKLIATLKAT